MRGRWVALVVASALRLDGVAHAQSPKPSVASLVLPTRRSDASEVHARVARIAAQVTARLAGERAPPSPGTALEGRLERAQVLFTGGALDEAATVFDAALEEGARSPHRLVDHERFVTAHITRVAIALARGEDERAAELLARIMRFDPSVMLSEAEASPAMDRAFAATKTALGVRPPFGVDDLGEACRETGDVLVVARALEGGAVELVRFDQCKRVAEALVQAEADEPRVAEMLAAPRFDVPATLSISRGGNVLREEASHWPPLLVGSGGLTLAIGGGVLVGLSVREFGRLQDSPCGMAGTCAESTYHAWEVRQRVGIGGLVIGGAVLVGAIIWGLHRRSATASQHGQVRVDAGGLVVAF